MLIVIICACIVGGMWWRTENRIKRLQKEMKSTENLIRKDLADNLVEQWKSEAEIDEKITLLSKDMMQTQSSIALLQTDNNVIRDDLEVMQTTVSNLVYRTNSNRLVKKLGIKPKSKKK